MRETMFGSRQEESSETSHLLSLSYMGYQKKYIYIKNTKTETEVTARVLKKDQEHTQG